LVDDRLDARDRSLVPPDSLVGTAAAHDQRLPARKGHCICLTGCRWRARAASHASPGISEGESSAGRRLDRPGNRMAE
jgi:hypothetical protein